MKIKVVRVSEDEYNIYHGFTGIPSTFPFCTKWMIDKKGLTKKEAGRYISRYALDYTPKAIIKW